MPDSLLPFLQHRRFVLIPVGILLATLVVTWIINGLLNAWRGRRSASARHGLWLDAALDVVNAPLQCMVWIVGLSAAAAELAHADVLPGLMPLFAPARDIAVVAVVAWFLIRVVPQATRTLVARTTGAAATFDETAADAINKTATVAILFLALMLVVQSLGFSLTSLLTFGGVAGIAVGFAAQGLVANLLGGMTIYTSKPFGVGDSVILPGTTLRGTVQEIGWRVTRILGWDGKPFYVPNAKFNTETIINHTRLAYRQLSETLLLRLADIAQIPAIVADVNRMLAAHPEMRHANEYHVFHLDGFTESAAKLYLYAYTKSTSYADYMAAKEDILLKIVAAIEAHGAHLAIPARALYAPHGLAAQGPNDAAPPFL